MRNVGKIVSLSGMKANVQVSSCSFTGLTEQYDGCDPLLSAENPVQKDSLNNFRQLFNAD
jgi:hypothetical protein